MPKLGKLSWYTLKKMIIIFSLLGIIFYCAQNKLYFLELLNKTQHLHGLGVVYFCVIYILSNMFFVPIGMPLNLFAGMVWGTLWGGILVNLLATFVATVSFYLARTIGKDFFDNFFNNYSTLRKFRKLISKDECMFICAARINPLVPFSISNYLFGLIPNLSFRRYIFATIVANIPPCFAFAAIGSTLKTFSLQDSNVRSLIWKVVVMLLLISVIFLMKWFFLKKNVYVSIDQEVA